MTKAELDAEYEGRLLELQVGCDHVLDGVSVGAFSCDCYGMCSLCGAEVWFEVRLERDGDGSVEVVSWRRCGGRVDGGGVIHRFGVLLSHAAIAEYYRNNFEWSGRRALAEIIGLRIRGKAMSEWGGALGG